MSQNPLASPRWAPALGAMRTFSPIPFDPSLACHQLLEAKRSGESRKLQGSPPGLGGLPGTLLGARPPTSASSLVSRPRRLGRPLSRPSPLLPSPRPFSSTPGPFDEPPWCTWTWGRQKRITGRAVHPPDDTPGRGGRAQSSPGHRGLGGGQPGPPASLLTLPCWAPSREGALLRVGRGAALPAAPAPDRPASLPQSTASSGPAAMGTAARASRWSSWCSRSSTATRPSRSRGHTAASAPAAWVSGSRGAGGCHGARGTLPASGQGSPPPGSLCRPARGGGGSEAGRQQDRLGQLVGQPPVGRREQLRGVSSV